MINMSPQLYDMAGETMASHDAGRSCVYIAAFARKRGPGGETGVNEKDQ
jgi:hypothetical protein